MLGKFELLKDEEMPHSVQSDPIGNETLEGTKVLESEGIKQEDGINKITVTVYQRKGSKQGSWKSNKKL